MYQLTDCRYGRFLVNPNDTYVGKSLLQYGQWSEAEIFLFKQIVQAGDTVLEAGANIGSMTVFFSKQVGPTGKVIAFEPQRLTHQLLCANLALNNCFNVDVRKAAIGSEIGEIEVPDIEPGNICNYGAVSLLREVQGAECEQVPINTVDQIGLDKLAFIKADIEGFEPSMLEGAKNTIRRCRPAIHMEVSASIDPRGNVELLTSNLRQLGYSCFYFLTPLYDDNNFKGNISNAFSQQFSVDIICLPEDRWQVSGLTPVRNEHDPFKFNADRGVSHGCQIWSGANITRR